MSFRIGCVVVALFAQQAVFAGPCERAFQLNVDTLKTRIVADVRSKGSLEAMVALTELILKNDTRVEEVAYGLEALLSILELPVPGLVVGQDQTYRGHVAAHIGRALLHRDLKREMIETMVNRICLIYFNEREAWVKRGLIESLFEIGSYRQDPSADYAMQALAMIEYRESDPSLKSNALSLIRSVAGVRYAHRFVLSMANGKTVESSQVVEGVTKNILIPLIDKNATVGAKRDAISALDALINELHNKGVLDGGAPLQAFMVALMIGPSVAVSGQSGAENLCLFINEIIVSGQVSDVSAAAWQRAAVSLLDEPTVPDMSGIHRPVSTVVSNPSLREVVNHAPWTIPYVAALQTMGDGLVWKVQSGPSRLSAKGAVNADVGVVEVTIYEQPQMTVGFQIPVSMHVDAFVPAHKQEASVEVTRDMGARIRKHLGLGDEHRFAIVYDKKPIAGGEFEGRFLLRLFPTVSVEIKKPGTYSPMDFGPQKSKLFHVFVHSMLKHFLEAARENPIQ